MKHAIVLSLIAVLASSAMATTFQPFNSTDTLDGWYKDRAEPAVFEIADFEGDSRLLHGVRAPSTGSGFYDFQGMKYDINLVGSKQILSIDAYIDSSWTNANQGMWATGFVSTDYINSNISAYPILAYRAKEDTNFVDGFYYYDYSAPGGWEYTGILAPSNSRWVNMSFELTVGQGVEYFVDGSSAGKFADPYTRSLGNVILNVYNNNSDQDYYWDNFAASAVPEPLTIVALFGGVTGLAGYVRRRRRA